MVLYHTFLNISSIENHKESLRLYTKRSKHPTQCAHPRTPQKCTNHHVPNHHIIVAPEVPKHLTPHKFVTRIYMSQIPYRGRSEVVFRKLGVARNYCEK
jgi:hypothetical protein